MDVNPRIGATFRLFVAANGMDVARALYLDLTGQPVPAGEMQGGRRWVVEDQDLVSSFRYWRDGRLQPGSWRKSFRGVGEGAYWATDDLLPLAAMVILDAAAAATGTSKKVSAAPAPLARHDPEVELAGRK